MKEPQELDALIKQHESTTIELKEGVNKEDLRTTITGFANDYFDLGGVS